MRFWHRLDCAADWRGDEMKYPCLVPKRLCKIPVYIRIESEELTEDGGPVYLFDGETMCNYQDSAKRVLTEQQKIAEVLGSVLVPGDLVPGIPAITGGEVRIFDANRRIVQGTKARNPDGSVNYTRLDIV